MIEKNGRIYYEVGDKVRVVNSKPPCTYAIWSPISRNPWLSKVLTIRKVYEGVVYNEFYVEENDLRWDVTMFEGLAEPFVFDDDEGNMSPGVFGKYFSGFKVVS